MKKIIIFLISLLMINVPLFARDIDLDRIYINPSSQIYKEITEAKEHLYSQIFSLQIDTGVIFSAWAGTGKVIYIKEIDTLNIVYEYSRGTNRSREIHRFRGNVTVAMLNPAGTLLAVKNLFYSSGKPLSQNIYIDTGSGAVKTENSKAMFKDMTFYPAGDSLLIHEAGGIVKYSPFTGTRELILPGSLYNDIIEAGSTVTAHLSPDRRKKAVIAGGGGQYRGRLFTESGTGNITGVSSSLDLQWIDNNSFVFRSGYAGNYSVKIFDTAAKRNRTLISSTLNPDIHYSHEAGIITFLHNQIINLYYTKTGRTLNTGIEGEVVYFAPDSSRFTSIYLGKLWLTNINMLLRRSIEIRRHARSMADLYTRAMQDKSVHENDYTLNYIKLKINLYKNISAGRE